MMACRHKPTYHILLFLLSVASSSMTWSSIVPPISPGSIYTGRYIVESQRLTLGDIIRQLQLEEERRNPAVDLRAYRLFEASGDYEVDCCPSFTQRNRRTFAINRQGLVIELFQTANFTQTFYETVCSNESSSHEADGAGVATVEDGGARPPSCKFIDPLFAPRSRCVQQWSYVYAIGRLFGRRNQQFSLDYVRIPTGCKCQVSFGAVAAVRVEHYGPPNRTSRAARDDKI